MQNNNVATFAGCSLEHSAVLVCYLNCPSERYSLPLFFNGTRKIFCSKNAKGLSHSASEGVFHPEPQGAECNSPVGENGNRPYTYAYRSARRICFCVYKRALLRGVKPTRHGFHKSASGQKNIRPLIYYAQKYSLDR